MPFEQVRHALSHSWQALDASAYSAAAQLAMHSPSDEKGVTVVGHERQSVASAPEQVAQLE